MVIKAVSKEIKGKFILGNRIWIIGSAGSGKSTLANIISKIIKIPNYELDYYYWSFNWKRNEESQFRNNIFQICNNSHWIIDGQYTQVVDIISKRVDTIIWLDEKLLTVLSRVIIRSFNRLLSKKKLWHGNVENLRMVLCDFIPYIIRSYKMNRQINLQLFQESDNHNVSFIHLKTSTELIHYLEYEHLK